MQMVALTLISRPSQDGFTRLNADLPEIIGYVLKHVLSDDRLKELWRYLGTNKGDREYGRAKSDLLKGVKEPDLDLPAPFKVMAGIGCIFSKSAAASWLNFMREASDDKEFVDCLFVQVQGDRQYAGRLKVAIDGLASWSEIYARAWRYRDDFFLFDTGTTAARWQRFKLGRQPGSKTAAEANKAQADRIAARVQASYAKKIADGISPSEAKAQLVSASLSRHQLNRYLRRDVSKLDK